MRGIKFNSDEFFERAKEVYAQDGYLVFAGWQPSKIGEIVPAIQPGFINYRWRVIGLATVRHADEQLARIGPIDDLPPWKGNEFFCRVECCD